MELAEKYTISGQNTEWWQRILSKAISQVPSSFTQWGKQDDPAWVMRRSFEAIKEGAYVRGLYHETDFSNFWSRFKDLENFRSMAKQ